MTFYQLIIFVVVGLIFFLLLKNVNERYAVFLSFAGGIALLLFIAGELGAVVEFINKLGNKLGEGNKYFPIILKGLFVCYLGEFTISVCKDCGQMGWADKVEMACRCTLLVLAIPLFEDFLNVIVRLMQ